MSLREAAVPPTYLHPASFTPPLAYGGHEWVLADAVATCWGCGLTVPIWALVEGLWMVYGPRWCPLKVAALHAAPRSRRVRRWPPPPPEMPGQLSIFDVLGESAGAAPANPTQPASREG